MNSIKHYIVFAALIKYTLILINSTKIIQLRAVIDFLFFNCLK